MPSKACLMPFSKSTLSLNQPMKSEGSLLQLLISSLLMVKSIIGYFFCRCLFLLYLLSTVSRLSLCTICSMMLSKCYTGLVKFLLAELQLPKYPSHKKCKLSKWFFLCNSKRKTYRKRQEWKDLFNFISFFLSTCLLQ